MNGEKSQAFLPWSFLIIFESQEIQSLQEEIFTSNASIL